MIIALIGISMPVFWLGEVANLVTQSRYHDTFLFSWVPPLGYTPLTQDPFMWFKHLMIPWIVLAVLYIGFYGRVLRADLVESESNDFVRTARAKGLDSKRVMIAAPAAQLDGRLHQPVRAGLRRAGRRRGAADGGRVRAARGRPAHL